MEFMTYLRKENREHQAKERNINHEDNRSPKREEAVGTRDGDCIRVLDFGPGLDGQVGKESGQWSRQGGRWQQS